MLPISSDRPAPPGGPIDDTVFVEEQAELSPPPEAPVCKQPFPAAQLLFQNRFHFLAEKDDEDQVQDDDGQEPPGPEPASHQESKEEVKHSPPSLNVKKGGRKRGGRKKNQRQQKNEVPELAGAKEPPHPSLSASSKKPSVKISSPPPAAIQNPDVLTEILFHKIKNLKYPSLCSELNDFFKETISPLDITEGSTKLQIVHQVLKKASKQQPKLCSALYKWMVDFENQEKLIFQYQSRIESLQNSFPKPPLVMDVIEEGKFMLITKYREGLELIQRNLKEAEKIVKIIEQLGKA
jgi:hypothetical protein